MTRREFHNGLRVLMNIDKWELEVTLGGEVSTPMWERFRDNPWQWFIKAPDSQAEAVFKVVEARNVAAKLTVNTCARCGGVIDPRTCAGSAQVGNGGVLNA